MEQELYAKFVMISRNDLKFIAENKNKNEAKFKFQGQSAISQRWFDPDFDWIEVSFSTRDPYYYSRVIEPFLFLFSAMNFKSFRLIMNFFHIILVPSPFNLYYFYLNG